MSNYNFKISDISISIDGELTVHCKITGDSFPQPMSNTLTLEENVLVGNFASNEGAELVTSFEFSYIGEVPVSKEFLVEFQNLPEDYTGVHIQVTANLSMPKAYVLDMIQAKGKDKDYDPGKTVRSRMSKTVTDDGEEMAIESYVLDSFIYNEQTRSTADMGLAQAPVSQLSGTCSNIIDFNLLTQPLLIAYHNQDTPHYKHVIGYIGITDN